MLKSRHARDFNMGHSPYRVTVSENTQDKVE